MTEQIVLSMIVKDEAHVIGRVLASVKPHIQAWAICDTGSTDDTRDRIRAALQDLPGTLLERPWVDFAHNRNEALDAARAHGSYALIIDADEELIAPAGLPTPDGSVDLYWLLQRAAGTPDMSKPRLFRNDGTRRFRGVLHEAVEYGEQDRHLDVDPVRCHVRVHPDGARSVGLDQRAKYRRDAATLETALQREPDNLRYVYYVGMSYLYAGEPGLARPWLRRRARSEGGFPGEAYDAWMQLGALAEQEARWRAAQRAYREAAKRATFRADPLVALSRLALANGELSVAYALAMRALEPPPPQDGMFVDTALYRTGRQTQFVECALRAGDHGRAQRWLQQWLKLPDLVAEERALFMALLRRAGG